MRTPFSVPRARRASFDSLIGVFDEVAHAAATTRSRGSAICFTMAVTIARSTDEGVSETKRSRQGLSVAAGRPLRGVAHAIVAPSAPAHRNRVQENGVV